VNLRYRKSAGVCYFEDILRDPERFTFLAYVTLVPHAESGQSGDEFERLSSLALKLAAGKVRPEQIAYVAPVRFEDKRTYATFGAGVLPTFMIAESVLSELAKSGQCALGAHVAFEDLIFVPIPGQSRGSWRTSRTWPRRRWPHTIATTTGFNHRLEGAESVFHARSKPDRVACVVSFYLGLAVSTLARRGLI